MRDFKSLTRIGAAVAILLVLGGCDSPEERAQKHLERGQALIEAGDTVKARLEFRNALRLNGNLVGARYELARLAEEAGDLRQAFGLYRDVAEAEASNVPVRIKLAQFLLAANDLEEARTYTDAAYALAPEDPEVLATKAAVDYRVGNTALARDLARRALAIAPDLVPAHIVLISDLVVSGDLAGALISLDEVLARLPEDQALHLLRLRILSVMNDPDQVRAQLERMVELYPDQLPFREALVQFHARNDDVDAAIAGLRDLAALRDDKLEGFRALTGYIYAARGAEAARAELAAALSTAGPELRAGLALLQSEVELRDGKPAEARRLLEEVVAEFPENANDARVRLAGLALNEGNREEARRLAETVLDGDGDNVAALGIRASVLIAEHKGDEALLDIRRALNLDPQNAQLMLLEANAHERNGNMDLMRERLASAARTSDYAPEISLRYAGLLRQQNQLSAAEAVMTEAVQRNPANPALLAGLAELRLQLGDLAGAETIASRLREVEGGTGVAEQVLAASLAQQGRLVESTAALERALADPAGNESALASLVASYVRQGQVERAEALLDDLIAANPENRRAIILRAEVHLLRGETDRVPVLLQSLIDQAPDQQDGYLLLSRFHLQQGDPAQAEVVMRAGVDAAPASQPLRLLLAERLELRGAIDDAIVQYEELYRLNPDSVVVVNNLASLLAEYRETDPEAIAFASRVARRLSNTTVPHFLDTAGWVAFLNGNTEEALEKLQLAATGLPNNPLVRYHLGRVYSAVGNVELARAELEASLAIAPDFPKAESARAALAALPDTDG